MEIPNECVCIFRGGICPSRHCRRQCKIFASVVNFSIFTHFFVLLSPKLLKFGEIKGVKFLAWKSGSIKFLTNLMSDKVWQTRPPLRCRRRSHRWRGCACRWWAPSRARKCSTGSSVSECEGRKSRTSTSCKRSNSRRGLLPPRGHHLKRDS